MRSSTLWGSNAGTLASTSRTTKAVRSSGRMSTSDPLKARPIGVRPVATMTASRILPPLNYWMVTMASIVSDRVGQRLLRPERGVLRRQIPGGCLDRRGCSAARAQRASSRRCGRACARGSRIFWCGPGDGRRGHELGLHYPLGRFVGALLVDGCLARHAEGHHDGTAVLFDQVLGRDRQVLEAGHGLGEHAKSLVVARTVGQFGHRGRAHVVPGEHGVDDTYLQFLLIWGHVTPIDATSSVGRFRWKLTGAESFDRLLQVDPEGNNRDRGDLYAGLDVARHVFATGVVGTVNDELVHQRIGDELVEIGKSWW